MSDSHYGDSYFAWQWKRNFLGIARGSRPPLHAYWSRYLRHHLAPGVPVLEVGCGLGFFAAHLRRWFPTTALDISLPALRSGRGHWGLPMLQADAQSLPVQSNTFAALVAFDLIEHLPDPPAFLAETYRVLRPGGLAVLSTPNPRSIGARAKGEEWFAHRDETHISIRPPDGWREAFRQARLAIEREGTDTLWDPPYIRGFPRIVQRAVCLGTQWSLTWMFGCFPWWCGENYVAVLRKP